LLKQTQAHESITLQEKTDATTKRHVAKWLTKNKPIHNTRRGNPYTVCRRWHMGQVFQTLFNFCPERSPCKRNTKIEILLHAKRVKPHNAYWTEFKKFLLNLIAGFCLFICLFPEKTATGCYLNMPYLQMGY